MTEEAAPRPTGRPIGVAWPHSDERLARQASKGRQRAFEAIYRRYHQDLYRFCLALVGNPQDAEEALQNTMVKVLRALPGEQRRIQLKPWLYRIARNESIETRRKRRDGVPIDSELISSAPQTAETAEAREHLSRLIADFAQLPERQRAALVMRELGGLGFAEIAAAFETSAATARQAVYEARLSLRQMEAGREMRCKQVLWELSEADGRVTRRRDIQAHLRSCHECREFQDAITRRRGEFGAIAPLPVAASAGLLKGILGLGHGAGGGSLAGTVGVGAAEVAGTSVIAKSVAAVAIVAAVGVTAADRGGMLDLPLVGDRGMAREEASAPPDPGAPATGAPTLPGSETGASGTNPGPTEVGPQTPTSSSGSEGTGTGQPAGPADADSRSQSASAAPGSEAGQGHSESRGEGKPDGLPATSDQGQETAAERKSPRANSSPGQPRSKGNTERPVAPPAKQSPPSSEKGRAPTEVDPVPDESPAAAKKSPSSTGAGMPADTGKP